MRRPVPGAGTGPACLRGVAGLAGKHQNLALSGHARAHDSCMHMWPTRMHPISRPERSLPRPLNPILYTGIIYRAIARAAEMIISM